MQDYRHYLLVMLVLGLSVTAEALGKGWHFSKEQRGVQIFSRFPEGSGFKQYKGEIVVNARPDRVLRLFQDMASTPEWHYRVKKVEVLKIVDLAQAYVHVITTPPWPIQSRDVVCLVSLVLDKKTDQVRITMKSVDNLLAARSEHIRLPKLESQWIIAPLTDQTSVVTYEIYSEPGGEIPRWLYNSVAMDIPLFTLINLKKRLDE